MTFVSNLRRDASPTIAGFVFQLNVTSLRELELLDGEQLELECGEDVASVHGRVELFTKGNLSYSPDACETCTLLPNRYPRRNDKTAKVFLLASRRTVQI